VCDNESDFDVWYMSDRRPCSGWCVDYSQKPALDLRAVEIEAVSIKLMYF